MSDSALEQKAVELITNLEKMAEPAMQITLQSIQAHAIIDMSLAFFLLGGVVAWWTVVAKVLYPKWKNTKSDVVEAAGGVAGVLTGLLSITAVTISITAIFSASNWLAIFAPELALARLLVARVL